MGTCRRRELLMRNKVSLVMVLGVILLTAACAAEDAIRFSDIHLKRAIEEQLDIFDPTASDMLKLTELDIPEEVDTLEGIDRALNLRSATLNKPVKDLVLLSKIPALTELRLYGKTFTSLQEIAALGSVTDLYLQNTQIEDFSPLLQMGRLQSLTVNIRHPIRDLSVFSKLVTLKKLTLCGAQINDISFISTLTDLTVLSLDSNEIADITPLAGLVKLNTLVLSRNQISDISVLSHLKNLSFLALGGNAIKDVSALYELEDLKAVLLYRNPLNKAAHERYLPALQQRNPELAIACEVYTAGNIVREFVLPGLFILYIVLAVLFLRRLRKEKKKAAYYIAGALFVLTVVPLPIRPKDIETAVRKSATSLLKHQRVLVVMPCVPYTPFMESEYFNPYKRVYYTNEIQVNDQVFAEMGLLPLPPADPNRDDPYYYYRNAEIGYTYASSGTQTQGGIRIKLLHFYYSLGPLNAYGYIMIPYRNIFGVHLLYIFEWIS